MPKDGSKTKAMILEKTTDLVLENGFAGTTIDHILDRTAITKGAFFYHFKNKGDLAMELIRNFARQDLGSLDEALEKVGDIEDPREQLLAFIQYWIDIFSVLETPYPGCLYASYVYEPEQFEEEVKQLVTDAILKWRASLSDRIREAMDKTQPSIAMDTDALADMFTVILEGAFIVSKALKDPRVTAAQLTHYRNYLELLFPIGRAH